MFFDLVYAMGQAPPAEGAAGAPNPLFQLIPFVAIFFIFYFLLIRPQQKKAQEHKKFLDSLQKGQEIMTAGGVYGKITGITEQIVTIEIADNTRIRVNRQFVSAPIEVTPAKQEEQKKK